MSKSFQELYQLSTVAHGHECAGQVLGVRMAMLGLSLLGYDAPLEGRKIKNVVIFVEIDRCAADALATTTGVKLGRRSLKFKDYGIMAATFVHLLDGKAFRVVVKEDCRDKAVKVCPDIIETEKRELKAYQMMPLSELFRVESVHVELKPEDLPGAKIEKAVCDKCGVMIRHRRYVEQDGKRLCLICAGGAYFTSIAPVEGIDAFDTDHSRRQYVSGVLQ